MKQRKFTYSAIDNYIMENHPQGSKTIVCKVAEGPNELFNKKLITAAPEMLKALNTIRDALSKNHYEKADQCWNEEINLIDEILEKTKEVNND